MKQTILVTGATGKQGGAVARHLIKSGFGVKALTRNSKSEAAKRLLDMGAQVFEGDLEKPNTLKDLIEGCDSVFSVQNFWEKGVGFQGEIRQAKNLIDAAMHAGIKQFVQASVAGCDLAPGVKHFESKAEIEKMVKQSGIPYTFLRASMFMENFIDPKTEKVFLPLLRGILPENLKIHLVAVDDIGTAATVVFSNPNQYKNEAVNLAGDLVSITDSEKLLTEITGRKPPSYRLPCWITQLINPDFKRQLKWNCGHNSNAMILLYNLYYVK